ncbi:MAG: glutamine synthetase family protein, partial [Rubrivivax sp.]|nr:glutamine synthetase family protein [Rubrivivax sp.]
MTSFAERCGVHDALRAAACEQVLHQLRERQIDRVRVAWCDAHGALRAKTLMVGALADALTAGIGMVGTLLLKDSADHTAFAVFDADAGADATLVPAGFAQAANLQLLPDPASLRLLPWAPNTAWLRADPWFANATPVTIDPRRALQTALTRLADVGLGLRCGLEVEFHIYRLDAGQSLAATADWPSEPPAVSPIHPGHHLLSEALADQADEALRIVQHTAQGLGLPLTSLEIEFGPSQVEAVFGATDALAAADQMVLFRNGVIQALRRAGYHASFVCRPPLPGAMASGWHLHQSLVDLHSGANACMRDEPEPGSTRTDARHVLSDLGAHYLAGLLAHAGALTPFCTPTLSGYTRFRPHAMAPLAALWGRDNRGAMLRVLGGAGDPGTRIENRLGEPMANPYLCIAAQIHAGLDGIQRQLTAPPATEAPYGDGGPALPASLGE